MVTEQFNSIMWKYGIVHFGVIVEQNPDSYNMGHVILKCYIFDTCNKIDEMMNEVQAIFPNENQDHITLVYFYFFGGFGSEYLPTLLAPNGMERHPTFLKHKLNIRW